MKKHLYQSKLLSVLVSLCLLLSYTPATGAAFADEAPPVQNDPAEVLATSLNCDNLELFVGHSTPVPYSVEPANASTSITINSSNTGVAAVSGSTVTGVSLGSATLTISDAKSGLSTSVNVTIKGAESIYCPGFSMVCGSVITLNPVASPSGVMTSYTFRSSNSRLEVTSGGVVTAKNAGSASVTVSDKLSGKSVNVPIKILNPSEAKINVLPVDVLVGKTAWTSYTGTPSDLLIDPVYSSSDTSVATVSESGFVTGVSAGTADITVADRKSGISGTAKVTVVQGLNSITTSDMTVYRGSPVALDLALTPENGATYELSYTSSNAAFASVDEAGLITGLNLGSAVITVSDKVSGLSARATVTVKDPDLAIEGESAVALVISDTCELPLVSSAPNPAVTWESSDDSVATVSASGTVTGVGAGTATITAKANYGSAAVSWTVEVSEPVISISGSSSATMKQGGTKTFKVSSFMGNPVITWKSSAASVASVDGDGTVTAGKLGTATITTTATGGNSVKFSVKVTSCKLGLEAGKPVSFSSVAKNVPGGSKGWASSKSSVAYVSGGKIIPVDKGKTTLSKTVKGVKYRIYVTCIKRGTISAKSVALSVGDSKKLSLSGAKVDTWSSSNPEVAKVRSNGTVTACSKGSAAVTCSDTNGFSYKVKVAVANPKITMKVVSTNASLGAYRALKVKVTNKSGKAIKLSKSQMKFYEKAGNEQPKTMMAYKDAGSYWGILGDHPLTVASGSSSYIYLVSTNFYVESINSKNYITLELDRGAKTLSCGFKCSTGSVSTATLL